MRDQHYGRILNVSSSGALGSGNGTACATAKAGPWEPTFDTALEGQQKFSRIRLTFQRVAPLPASRTASKQPPRATTAMRLHLATGISLWISIDTSRRVRTHSGAAVTRYDCYAVCSTGQNSRMLLDGVTHIAWLSKDVARWVASMRRFSMPSSGRRASTAPARP